MSYLFAFQIVPGSDDLLGYCITLEEAVTKAAAHRKQLIRNQALGDEDSPLHPSIALYQLDLQPITLELLLPVFNKQQDLPQALIAQMTQIGAIE